MATASLSVLSVNVREGAGVTATITLSSPVALASEFTIALSSTGPQAVAHGSAFPTLASGQTSVTFTIPTFEDSAVGNGIFEISGVGRVAGETVFFSTIKGTVQDNDGQGFSINPSNLDQTFTAITQLPATPQNALQYLGVSIQNTSSRPLIARMADLAVSTTSVAVASYQFFTSTVPSQAGLRYLVNSPDNPSDLNDPAGIYAIFSLENRYINFAANLGLVGEGRAKFAADYGSLSFAAAVDKAYDTIIGKAVAQAAGVNVSAAIADISNRSGYFTAVANERMKGFDADLAAKAGLVGYIMAEAIKADVGVYARAIENFYLDAADGSAKFGTDLIGSYGPGTPVDLI